MECEGRWGGKDASRAFDLGTWDGRAVLTSAGEAVGGAGLSGEGKLSERGVAQVKSEVCISPSHQSTDANRHSVTPGDSPGRRRGQAQSRGPWVPGGHPRWNLRMCELGLGQDAEPHSLSHPPSHTACSALAARAFPAPVQAGRVHWVKL